MEALELNGATYVKATAIARELGYTADYVGQLCRGGKVDAELVGRSWYVREESIRAHKKNRYRSNTAKTVTALKETIAVEEDKAEANERVPVRRYFESPTPTSAPNKNFYSRSNEITALYTEDDSELIPTLTRRETTMEPAEVEVRHADAKPVEVTKTEQSYNLEATERPKIRFKGQVSIVEPEETESTEIGATEGEEKTAAKEETQVHTKKRNEDTEKDTGEHKVAIRKEVAEQKKDVRQESKPKTKTLHPTDQIRRKTFEVAITTDKEGQQETAVERITLKKGAAVAMVRKSAAHPQQGEIQVTKIPTFTPESVSAAHVTGRYTFLYIAASIALALLLGAGFMLLESTVVATDDSYEREYSVNISAVMDSIHGLK